MKAQNNTHKDMIRNLDRLHSLIYRLKVKAERVDWEAETDYKKAIGELEIKESEVREKLQHSKLQQAISQEDDRTDQEEEIGSLEKAVEEAVSNLK